MLECPNCGEFLTPISINTTGGSLDLDHCLNCGGTWFDPYEINRITTSDVLKLGQILSIKKKDVPWGKMERLCPRDFNELHREKPEISMENIVMERCSHCRGIFIMQKDLAKLKGTQESKINTFKKQNLPFSLAAVFIPFVAVSLLMFSTFMTITNLSDAQNSQIKATGQLQALETIPVTDSTVSILFLTKSETKTSITYGTNFIDQKTQVVSIVPTKTHQTTLKNLKPGTLYSYRIIIELPSGEKVQSKVYTFETK